MPTYINQPKSMNLKISLIAGALVALGSSVTLCAQKNGKDPSPTPLGAEQAFDEYIDIQVKNFQGVSLGRIKDLGIDLVHGRIVEVLVVTNASLEGRQKVIGVPPLALFPDHLNQVYRIDASAATFDSAPAIVLKKWQDTGRSARVAATYRLFGQEPYFLEEGETANPTDSRPKVALGYMERANKILDLPVANLQHQKFGKVWSMTMDIPQGRVLSVIILAPGNFLTKSIVPAMALSFNDERNGLVIDDTKKEFSDEPRYIFTAAANGQDAHSKSESYTGPHTSVALEQGRGYRDVDQTDRIKMNIRSAKVGGQNVQVGTINDRVTLRGWVSTDEDKRRIGEIAIAASRPELVDNQITVGKPVTGN
jgi:sporulation protein YlmC with PRC-barrel domain